jgi:metallo-beta-lactamase family protein
VFLDSPLAGRTTEVFRRHAAALGNDGNRFTPGDFRFTETVEQSKAIDRIHGGTIVLAGSGMCDAGRVKHHLKNHLWRPDSTVLFVGYQAPGTLGATIREGAAQVRIHGEEVRIKARIRAIDAYSGHADRDELVDWVRPVLPTLALTGMVNALVETGLAPERIAVPSLDQAYEFSYRDGRWIAALSNAEAAPRLSVEEVTATRDWHNEYAQTLLDLRSALNRATDNRVRRRLLREVRRVIDEAHR